MGHGIMKIDVQKQQKVISLLKPGETFFFKDGDGPYMMGESENGEERFFVGLKDGVTIKLTDPHEIVTPIDLKVTDV